MLRAAKVMEPEAGCDLCEAKVSFGAKEKEKTYNGPATFSSGSVT
jgi:hypothetical protein